MESNPSENQLQAKIVTSLLRNQGPNNSQKIKFKPLRYKLKIDWTKPKEGRKKKAIGTRCYFSSTFHQHQDPQSKLSVLHESLKGIHGAKAIKNLEFEFSKQAPVLDNASRDIMKKLRYCSSLQRLKLRYEASIGLSNKTIANITQGLKAVPRIKDLHLRAQTTGALIKENYMGNKSHQITDEGLAILSERLKRMNGLERLTFEFDANNWITDEGLFYFSQGLRKHNAFLKTINLGFRFDNQIGDQGIRYLSENLKKCISVENFCLFLNRSTQVGDLALEHLNYCLKNFMNLKMVKLNFRGCDRISDLGAEKILDGLEKHEKLERIWLNFRGCDKITDIGAQGIGQRLKGLKALKRLTLKLRGCDKLTDQGLIDIIRGISALQGGCLENLTLNLAGCRKMTNESLREIWLGLRDVTSLKNVQLSLKGLNNLTDSEITQMVEALKVANPSLKLTIVAENVQIWQGVRL